MSAERRRFTKCTSNIPSACFVVSAILQQPVHVCRQISSDTSKYWLHIRLHSYTESWYQYKDVLSGQICPDTQATGPEIVWCQNVMVCVQECVCDCMRTPPNLGTPVFVWESLLVDSQCMLIEYHITSTISVNKLPVGPRIPYKDSLAPLLAKHTKMSHRLSHI